MVFVFLTVINLKSVNLFFKDILIRSFELILFYQFYILLLQLKNKL